MLLTSVPPAPGTGLGTHEASSTCQRLITCRLIRDVKPMFHVLHDCRLQRTVPRPLGGERLELPQHVDPTDAETSASGSPEAPSNPGHSTPGLPGRRGQPARARRVQDPPLRNKTEHASAKLRAGEERSQNSQVNGPSARRQEEFALEVTNPLTKGISGPSRWPGWGWSVGPDAKKGHHPNTRDPGPQIQWTVPMHSLLKASKKWKESSIQTDSWKRSQEVATRMEKSFCFSCLCTDASLHSPKM